MSAFSPESVAPPPPGFTDIPYQAGVIGQPFRVRLAAGTGTYADVQQPQREAVEGATPPAAPAGAQPARSFNAVEGLSMVKPPYGVMSAIDLRKGELKWQVPHGDTPDVVRNHAKLKGINIPKTGQGGSVGVLVTKTLVIAGDPLVTTTPNHPRGAMIRAYNKETGQEVGAVWMPAPVSGSPMTYRVGGRQYIVIAVSGGNYSGEYIAFALPSSDLRDTGGGTQQ
jgi:quinoprotein glucose dehydrogenase